MSLRRTLHPSYCVQPFYDVGNTHEGRQSGKGRLPQLGWESCDDSSNRERVRVSELHRLAGSLSGAVKGRGCTRNRPQPPLHVWIATRSSPVIDTNYYAHLNYRSSNFTSNAASYRGGNDEAMMSSAICQT